MKIIMNGNKITTLFPSTYLKTITFRCLIYGVALLKNGENIVSLYVSTEDLGLDTGVDIGVSVRIDLEIDTGVISSYQCKHCLVY